MYRAARARYLDVDVGSRIEGASPHRLIAILFEELDKALDALGVAHERGDRGRALAAQGRALTILHGLETGLDFERGGEIATGLAAIYREARRQLQASQREHQPERTERVRAMIAEIAGAWAAIG
jgi:flagellar protein FliS